MLFAAQADAVVLTFDSVASGTAANDLVAGQGLRFDLAIYAPDVDEFGDEIPGTEQYRPDPEAVDAVRVGDPQFYGYGAAPSPVNALDALWQGVLITFDTPQDLTAFSVTLDDSTFGYLGTFDIVFQDASGTALFSLPTQQSVPLYVASLAGGLSGVSSIFLPSGAFYDDLEIAPVPEPGTLILLAAGIASLAVTTRRRSA